jgi:signal transduction histidine kinase
MILFSIVLAVVFLGMNVILYLLNQTYLERKIEEENTAFLELTTMLMEESDLDVALAYMEHYTHIHDVEIELRDASGDALYASTSNDSYARQYTIDTAIGTYTVAMDNTTSVTALTVRDNFLYVNLTLFLIYALAIVALYLVQRSQSKRIETDLHAVLRLTTEQWNEQGTWSYDEFRIIHGSIVRALETIDLLYEQRNQHTQSLAHDIKTPLTVLYSYLADPSDQKDPTAAMDAAKSINRLVEDLLEERIETDRHSVDLRDVIQRTIARYERVFATKDMTITTALDAVSVHWNATDCQRVLENLLGNAYDYSKAQSVVHITLTDGDPVTWTVTSRPQDPSSIHPDRLFDKGYSSSSRTTKGLGLYNSKLLLQSIGGTIAAELDKDTIRFVLRIPS